MKDNSVAGTLRVPSAGYGTRSVPATLAIIGGGLAGMAAAVAAIERGFRVELFEVAPRLGGRAGSLLDATTGEHIDYCQHVAMGCCRSFHDFCRRTAIEDCFERSATLHFMAPDGACYDFAPCRWLPAPLHLLPGLMNLKYLSLGQRWGVVRTLIRLMRSSEKGTIGGWLQSRRHAPRAAAEANVGCDKRSAVAPSEAHRWCDCASLVTPYRVIERFWSVVLVSALGETLDHASLSAAQQVFREGFLASRDASQLWLPRMPLGDVLHDRVGKWLIDRGVAVHLNTPVRQIELQQGRAAAVVLADGTRRALDLAVAAVPWRNVRSLFVESDLAAIPSLAGVEQIKPAAITAVHLWFDRPITSLPHAVLVARRSQWVFARPCDVGVGWVERSEPHQDQRENCDGARCARSTLREGQQYVQVVISASHRLPPLGHDELLGEVRGELEAIWPAARDARLLHGRVIAQPAAIFSMTPEVDRFRPPQQTPIAGLALAGDWTATGWPATMEGAVRSGLSAVKALAS